jgi:hypothetical protein
MMRPLSLGLIAAAAWLSKLATGDAEDTLTGTWTLYTDFSPDNRLAPAGPVSSTRLRTLQFKQQADGMAYGHYVGDRDESLFTARRRTAADGVRIEITQNEPHTHYIALYSGHARSSNQFTGTWVDVEGNGGDVVFTRVSP